MILKYKTVNRNGDGENSRDFQAGDVYHSLTNISKANKLLGYRPGHRITEGMKR